MLFRIMGFEPLRQAYVPFPARLMVRRRLYWNRGSTAYPPTHRVFS